MLANVCNHQNLRPPYFDVSAASNRITQTTQRSCRDDVVVYVGQHWQHTSRRYNRVHYGRYEGEPFMQCDVERDRKPQRSCGFGLTASQHARRPAQPPRG
jgi:hypothetical protein